jgi:hypothetical protein
MGGTCRTHGGDEDLYKILVEGVKSPRRPRHTWEDDIKTVVKFWTVSSGGLFEHGKECSCSINAGKLLASQELCSLELVL